MRITDQEREKYELMWGIDDYANVSPGAIFADLFNQICKPVLGQSVIDVGAGAGAGSRVLKDRFGLVVRAFDITDTAWKHEDIPLLTGSVWRDLPRGSPICDFAYCCDMMEHIPTEYVALSVNEILLSASRAFFTISFQPEYYGQFIQKPLHLTVRDFRWWRDLMRELGTVHEARDLMGEGAFLVSR